MRQQEKNTSIFYDWRGAFLNKRSLPHPDGRAIFRYRLTDQEFSELKSMLQTATWNSIDDLGRKRAFISVWFLYAAEWWKRLYDGSAWSWKRIFDSIPLEVPPHSTLRLWVRQGSEFWRLPQYLDHGHKYIGQVILNGGLPLRLIENADGSIAGVLKSVLRRVVPVSPPLQPHQIRAEVDEHTYLLPETFRQSILLDLLTEIVVSVNELTHQHLHSKVDDPIQTLDRIEPGWRNRFPMELDSESARRMLKGLLREATAAGQVARHPFMLRRGMLISEGGNPTFVVKADVVNRFKQDQISQILNCTEEEIPPSFDLSVMSGGESRMIGRAVTRSGEVRVEMFTAELPASWFGQFVQLAFSRFGETLFVLDLPGGIPPEDGLPWLFEDAIPFARLIRAGSCKLRQSGVLALLPQTASLFCPDAEEQLLGRTADGLHLYRLTAGDWAIGVGGECFSVQCGAACDNNETLLWHGKRLHLESHPVHVFTGLPKLSRLTADGAFSTVPADEIFWVSGGQRVSLASQQVRIGAGTLVWQHERQIQTRLPAICLPEDAKISYEAGQTHRQGIVRLSHWPAVSIAVLTEDVIVEATREGNGWRLDVRATSVAPPTLALQINWPAGVTQQLVVPFPAQGVVLTQADGQPLPAACTLTVHELMGLRARMLSPNPNARWTMHLALQGNHNGFNVHRKIVYKGQPGNGVLREVRLFELTPVIQQMLASVDELDVLVDISFESNGKSHQGFRVARYGLDVERDSGQGVIRLCSASHLPAQDKLAATRVLAAPLLQPDAQVELPALFSEEVANGSWSFSPENRAPGTWLIYPVEDAACQFRPMAWYVHPRFANPEPLLSDLGAALSIADRTARLEQLSLVFDKLVSRPDHPDWALLETMQETLGHLPLATLDVWVALARHTRAITMAMLHLEGFAERLANRVSKELPFEWVLSSPADWVSSLKCLKDYWEETGGDRSVRAFVRDAQDKLETLRDQYPAMRFTVCFALASGLKLPDLSIQLIRAAPDVLWQKTFMHLFDGARCASQRLFQRSAEDATVWPNSLKLNAYQFIQSPYGKRLFASLEHLQGDDKLPAIAMPLMIAYQVAEGRGMQWMGVAHNLAALREYRDFDPDWFETAYQAGLIFALIDGLIEQ